MGHAIPEIFETAPSQRSLARVRGFLGEGTGVRHIPEVSEGTNFEVSKGERHHEHRIDESRFFLVTLWGSSYVAEIQRVFYVGEGGGVASTK